METLHRSNPDPPRNNADGSWQETGSLHLPTLWILPWTLQNPFAALGDMRYSLGQNWCRSPRKKEKKRNEVNLLGLQD